MDKIEKGHPLSQSPDMIQENLAKLKQLFPTIVKEGKIDVTELQALLGEELETGEEYYRFTWAGKSMARQEANKPSTGTLRPDKAASKNWDSTDNLFIEGDNLEVLKLLQKSYAGKVKMIYIDPPYNTGKDFVYKDNYKDNLGNYLAITGQTDEEGRKLSTNTESDGRYHSNWLCMMYPRLKLAHNLLREDGVIFMSIDDNEQANLKKICDEIFGEENFESMIAWRRRHNQPNDKSKMIAKVSESILVYSRNSIRLKELGSFYGLPLSKSRIADYQNPDNDPKGPWSTNPWKAAVGRGGTSYKITTISGLELEETWYGNEDTFKKYLSEGRVYWTDDGNGFPRIKIYLSEALEKGQSAVDFFTHDAFGSNQESSLELKALMNREGLFDNPKPVRLISSLIKIACSKSDFILDFFAGSGTTAHAVMELNAEDGGNRKFICVQLPEPTEPESEAHKAGYKVISDITKERIRRAGANIEAEWQAKQAASQKANGLFASTSSSTSSSTSTLDTGFRAFKLDTSNIVAWDGSIENFEQNLLSAAENIKPDRSAEDVLFEILLKAGLNLTVPIEEKAIDGKTVYNIGAGALFVCLAGELTTAVAEGIGQWKQQLSPATCRIIFRDTGFTDVVKTNSIQILRRYGVEEVHTI